MPNRDKRGMILFIVIGIIMVVVILSMIILRVIASHSRLTHHQVSRIQAQYAAKAGMVYALEMLRMGSPTGWTYSPNSCPVATPCSVPKTGSETGFPSSILSVKVVFVPGGSRRTADSAYCVPPPGYSYCVSSTADFLYPKYTP